MTNARRRLSLAALIATAALSPAMPAQASAAAKPLDCETRLERLEERFRKIEERRGWEYASEWWQDAWQRYYKRCG